MTNPPEKLGSEYYRNLLTWQGKAFYDRIHAQLDRGDYSGKTILSVGAPKVVMQDCFAAYKAIRDDHPEYFYLGFQSEFTHNGQVGVLKYPMLYNAETIERIHRQLQKSIRSIVQGTAYLPQIERETIVYERISKRLVYTNHEDVRDHNIVGPVLLSSGVCEGHNALLMLCLRRIGIPCIKVFGKTKTDGNHCWTIAWVNGTPVHCDVTWDRATDGIVFFDYLNLSDNQISADHFMVEDAHFPVCTTERLNYYRYHNLCVCSFHELRERIKTDSSMGTSLMRMHFNYRPLSGGYLDEVKRALLAERIKGNHILYYHQAQKNMAVKRGIKLCTNRLSGILEEMG